MAHDKQAAGRGTATVYSSTHPRTLYLTLYNSLFAFLWAWIGLQTLTRCFEGSTKQELYTTIQPLVRWVQTLTLIEVAHAAVGIIKSPVSTTAIQIFTRVIQVWMIWWCFPVSTATSRAFPVLVLAWAVADSIRYFYLALNLHGRAPSVLCWLRYTMFFPLYPIGIGAEWWLMYQTVRPAGEISKALEGLFCFLLALYVPGAYTMFTHMTKQRRKALGRRRLE